MKNQNYCQLNQGSTAQNEGSMEFREVAYTYMWKDVALIEIEDCSETVDDIKRIFRKIAMHDMKKHNEAIRNGEKKAIPMMPDAMPGFSPDKIKIERLSNTLLPTDITTGDGVIRINENFVKIMYVMGEWGLKKPFGKIPMYAENRLLHDDIIGEMYESIIYSLAIHTIRGHFPISDDGKAMFNSNEFTAQSERGRKHRYVNTLAMLYYWILLLERHQYVVPRARIFMRKYPHIFKDLTEGERFNLPFHLMHFVDFLYNRESLPHKGRIVYETGENRDSVHKIVRSYPNASSNEGTPAEEDEEAMNEGDIHLHDRTFRGVYADIKGLEDDEVKSTERLIRTIFRNVAMHEILEHNSKVEDKYKVREQDMPGLEHGMITFEDLSSDLMVPTDVTTKDGRIRINNNFVKMMHIFMMNPEDTAIGQEFSKLGKTIIYSLAIHTIRGHFEIVPQGFLRFIKDESRAQPERGHSHLYQNILGMLYYWIMAVERHYFPHTRAKEFMEENPSVLKGLTEEQKQRLPWDLKALCDKFSTAGLLRRTDFSFPTEMTREKYQLLLDHYPDAVSNEGNPLK